MKYGEIKNVMMVLDKLAKLGNLTANAKLDILGVIRVLSNHNALLKSQCDRILKKYVEIDEDGNPKTVIDKNKQLVYVIPDMQSYNKEISLLLNKDVGKYKISLTAQKVAENNNITVQDLDILFRAGLIRLNEKGVVI
jgi:hypothetical protein